VTKNFWIKYLPASLHTRIEDRACLKNVVSNTGWQFADNILRIALGLVVGVWVARYLGPEQLGLLSYAMAFASMFAAFASLGLDDIIVRDLVREPTSRGTILGTAFGLRLVSGTASFATTVAMINVLRPFDGLSHWIVGIVAAGTILQAVNVIEFWFHSQVQAKYTVLARSGAYLICSLIKVVLIFFGAPVIAFALVALFEVLVGMAGLIVAYHVTGGRLGDWRCRIVAAKRLLMDGWPLMLSGIVIQIYLRIDQVMLGEMAGNEELGIYSVAVRLAELWFFVPTAFCWSVFPGIVEAKSISDELFSERLQQFYNLVALAAYAVALPTTLVAHWLVPTLFGEVFARGGLMLAVLIWANVFIGLEMARSSFLTVMNWTRLYLVTVTLGCLLNIALNLWLIPLYGGMGAVIASLVAYWFAAHGSCFCFRSLHRTGAMLTRALVYPKIW